MKRLKRMSKEELLYNLFPEIGDSKTVEEVLLEVGSSSLGSLKVMMSRLKNTKVFSKDSVITLSMKQGKILRIK